MGSNFQENDTKSVDSGEGMNSYHSTGSIGNIAQGLDMYAQQHVGLEEYQK